ncbi:MAG TPA: TetR/AcrR family transcriptional regulator [Burkholderiaceae bacterium]|nr:TetR/AcrR family transcriptional regulator [Burkholderiaceae bacterium]
MEVPDSRQRMIEAAIRLLRGSGLSGAGINDVVRESAAPKGSVYHFFPAGKEQLVAEALTEYSRRVQEFIDTAMAGARSDRMRVRRLFEAMACRVEQGEFRRSCAFGTVCLDLEPGQDALRELIQHGFDAWATLIASRLDLGDAGRTRDFARLVLTAIEGAYIVARAERSGRAFRAAGRWLECLVDPAPARRKATLRR